MGRSAETVRADARAGHGFRQDNWEEISRLPGGCVNPKGFFWALLMKHAQRGG
jgi:hypothetical protein